MTKLENTDNLLAELHLKTQEINSSLIILQQAVQNESAPATISDINNYLELILEKFPNISDLINEITEIYIEFIEKK